MDNCQIVPWDAGKLPEVMTLWGRVFRDRATDFRIDAESFRRRVLENEAFDPAGAWIATDRGSVIGFVLAAAPKEAEGGYLSVLMVDEARRTRGVGGALLARAEAFVADAGKPEIRVDYRGNPFSFATGADPRTPAYYFLLNHGFRNDGSLSLVMRLEFKDYGPRPEIDRYVEENRARGIRFGLCGAEHREALCRFMVEFHPGGWEASVKRNLDGDPPYPVLVATEGPVVVGFTGPISVREGGAGGFSGIGTRPDRRRGKIGTVLFHLLCTEFKSRGAQYSVLHTGLRNPAQEIYFGAGYRVLHLADYCLTKRLAPKAS